MEGIARIKGMVCRRCITTVQELFTSQGFTVARIALGEVAYQAPPGASLTAVRDRLRAEGFELLDDRQSRIITRVKELAEEHLSGPAHHGHHFSQMVAEALGMEYDSISALFSATEGQTLEQYLIGRRVEKVKQMLRQTKLALTDIAFQVGYSSVHHLSNQFKKITGLTPTQYRRNATETAG